MFVTSVICQLDGKTYQDIMHTSIKQCMLKIGKNRSSGQLINHVASVLIKKGTRSDLQIKLQK